MNNSNNLTHQLNQQQLAAVKYVKGAMMIIAGPGAGKTKVITERIIHLMNIGIHPENILALTLTNKAAKEMIKRINDAQKNNNALSIWMGTFHSIFARILREKAHVLGYTSNFTIYDNEDSIKIIRRIKISFFQYNI